MNEHTSHPQSHLGRLLEEASAHYSPQPDVARFERMLLVQHRRRAGVIVWSAAACFALIGGTAFAFNQGDDDDHRLSPAHSQVEDDTESTAVKTTDYQPDKTQPDKTLPDGGRDPIDKTTVPTVPKTEPPTTEKQKEAPQSTQPKTTEPKTTEPKEATTTTVADDGTWSVHQTYFTSDAEPPFEVFWGTANIGDKIKIESAYGWVKVFADDQGNWSAQITFSGAPVGVPFEIWVHAPYHDEVFSFTYLG